MFEKKIEVGDEIKCKEGRLAVVTSVKCGKKGRYLRHRHSDNGSDGSCLEEACTLIRKKGERKMLQKKIWEVTVIDKEKEKVLVDRKLVIDGCEEKDVRFKVGLTFSDILKDIVFENLVFCVREVGSFERKEKKSKDED